MFKYKLKSLDGDEREIFEVLFSILEQREK